MKYLQGIPTTKRISFNHNFHQMSEIRLQNAYNNNKGIHVDNDTM